MTMLILELKKTYLPTLDNNIFTGVAGFIGVNTIDDNNNDGVEDDLPSNSK